MIFCLSFLFLFIVFFDFYLDQSTLLSQRFAKLNRIHEIMPDEIFFVRTFLVLWKTGLIARDR